jgi:glutathione peroxidase
MNKILFLLVPFIFFNSIYNYSLNDTEGNSFSLSQFKGKKILFVNTASSSEYVGQLASFEQLYEKYKDSLVIIAVPSNTFQDEPKSNAELKSYIESTWHTHFIITEKTIVAGAGQSPVYSWLSHQSENGMMENNIDGDFYKFLVNADGKLVGAFAPSVDPMSDEMQSAITN